MQKNLPLLSEMLISCRYLFKAPKNVWSTCGSHKFTDQQYSNVMFWNTIPVLKRSTNGNLLYWRNVLSLVIQSILACPQWSKQWCFQVFIHDVNILGNIIRVYVCCIFGCSQQVCLELFCTTFCNKIYYIIKVVCVIPNARRVMQKKVFRMNRFVLGLFMSNVKLASRSIFHTFVHLRARVW